MVLGGDAMSDPIFSCGAEPRTTNAQALDDCRVLGYLTDEMSIVDLTYGLGRFWNIWRPEGLICADINPERTPDGVSTDFRATGLEDRSVDAVVLDGPYKYAGGPSKDTTMDDDYGVDPNMPPEERDRLLRDGVYEACRVARSVVLVKSQDQVVSGRKRWQTRMLANYAEGLGWRLKDVLYVRSHRPQPPGRRQVHSASDLSALQIFVPRGRGR